MRLSEFLETFDRNEQFTFIITKAVKDDNTPFYHNEFRQTPIRTASEWLNSIMPDKYIIIKKDNPPIDISGMWDYKYKKGHLKCCIITTEEEVRKMYKEPQATEMIEWYDKKMRE